MDSGSFVLKGLLEMNKKGIYGSALIKRGAIGLGGFMEMVLTSTSGKKIGDVVCLSGEWNKTEFNIF